MTPDALLARLLYRDGLILIIDKPAGLPVHAGPKGGDNLERHFEHLRFGLPRPPALAHRLDRDTSGCLVLGRHPKALRRLGKLFQDGKVEKTYWAVLRGVPQAPEGLIDLPLKKVATDPRSWWMQTTAADDPDGMATVTGYKLLGAAEGLSWVEFGPKTGRTHQIRVHAAALGCPVYGDPVYGDAEDKTRAIPMHLHARAIRLPLYPNKEPVAAQAEPPEHMQEALRRCGWSSASGVI